MSAALNLLDRATGLLPADSGEYQVTGAVLSELRKNEVSEATLDALKPLEEKKRINGRESFVHEVEARLPEVDARLLGLIRSICYASATAGGEEPRRALLVVRCRARTAG